MARRVQCLGVMKTTQPSLFSTYENAKFEPMAAGATTWRKGERVTVIEFLPDTYAEPMYAVRFSDGSLGVFKPSELGLYAADVPAYLAAVRS